MRSIEIAVRVLLAIALAGLGLALPGVQARGGDDRLVASDLWRKIT